MSQRRLTPWEAWDRFPPYYVRLLAKSARCVAMTDTEIAIRSGIDLSRVRQIKFFGLIEHTNEPWRGMDTWEQRAYVEACRFDPTDARCRRRVKIYEETCQMRNTPPGAYLRRSPNWETELLPIVRLVQSRTRSAAA